MIDTKKVIAGMYCCTEGDVDYFACDDCPYHEIGRQCSNMLRADLITMIKYGEAYALQNTPQARVMTYDEVVAAANDGWRNGRYTEIVDGDDTIIFPGIIKRRRDALMITDGTCCDYAVDEDNYGKEIRCWTSAPNDEQRDEPWNEDAPDDDEHPTLQDVVFVSKDDGQWCVNMRNDFFEQDDIKYLMEHRSDGGCDAVTLFEMISGNVADTGGIICDAPCPDLFERISKIAELNDEVVLRALPLLLERQMITVRDGKYVVPISFESDE